MLTGSLLDYLRALADLEERRVPLRNGAIAAALGVKPPSVTGMIRRMRDQGLLEDDGDVRLTQAGRKLACTSVRRHRLVETWLIQTLGLDWATAHEEAHRLEHAISPRLEKVLDERLGRPERDPHGARIPKPGEASTEQELVQLSAMPDGMTGTVARLSDRDPDKLAYWASAGLTLGAHVKCAGAAPYEGPLELLVGGTRRYFSASAVEGVWIRAEETGQ